MEGIDPTVTQLGAKFIRSHYASPAPQNQPMGAMGWVMRLLYEFWGFCVHGTSDVSAPGSMASSGSYLRMPVGFESGSTVLLASGSDGYTVAGMPYFTVTGSSPFNPSCVGKWLTIWKSGSTSTDDSVYQITSWLNSSSVAVDASSGGTPVGSSGSVPVLTTRSDVCYRVVDYYAASGLTYTPGDYMVLQFNDASTVNPGQANTQVRVYASGTSYSDLHLVLSPSGSWNGSAFAGEPTYDVGPETLTNGAGWGTADWWHGNTAGRTGYVSLVCGTGFLVCHVGGPWMTACSFFAVEVPKRLYPASNDPNPVCAANFGNLSYGVQATLGRGYAHRFFPSPYDSTFRRWPVMVRSYTGSGFDSTVWGGSVETCDVGRWNVFVNPRSSVFVSSDGVLTLPTVAGQAAATGQFSLARARLRSMRFCASGLPMGMRVSDETGDWIHVAGGVMLPWDRSVLGSRPLFPGA